MLPPGHTAAGFLTSYALLKFVPNSLTPHQIHQLWFWGAAMGFAPDWDYFLAFFREKAWIIKDMESNNHRKFPTHAPVVWLVAGLMVCLFGRSEFARFLGVTVWLASWSHFFIDTVEYGIIWLWPFSTRKFAFKGLQAFQIAETKFFPYWWKFVKSYIRTYSFYLEILIIMLASAIFIRVL